VVAGSGLWNNVLFVCLSVKNLGDASLERGINTKFLVKLDKDATELTKYCSKFIEREQRVEQRVLCVLRGFISEGNALQTTQVKCKGKVPVIF
jgi:hypothetical protein